MLIRVDDELCFAVSGGNLTIPSGTSAGKNRAVALGNTPNVLLTVSREPDPQNPNDPNRGQFTFKGQNTGNTAVFVGGWDGEQWQIDGSDWKAFALVLQNLLGISAR
jgi:hypothetical protein